jgi:acyl phosphate:glycerol-3-phosphate acyltransferase
MIFIVLIVLASYLAGSIPTAIIASRLIIKDDIRNHGSGNAGATNVFRVLGWKPALVVFLVDAGKGAAAVLLFSRIGTVPLSPVQIQILAGLAAIAGHIWTIFAGFKGGKGVGTAFGVLVSLAPLASIITLVFWILVLLISRIVSLASLTACLLFPIILLIQKYCFTPGLPRELLALAFLLALLIIVTHRSNIKRLLKGEEPAFGKGEK